MSFKDIKNKLQSERGFTIVELLIVIVVIGILAGITIVAYNGVTTRANATKAQTNAASIQKVAEAYNADSTTSGYPTQAQLNGYTTSTALATKPAGVLLSNGTTTTPNVVLSATNGTTTILYGNKSNTGACIGWWDYNKASGSNLTWILLGDAATPGIGGTGGLVTCAQDSSLYKISGLNGRLFYYF